MNLSKSTVIKFILPLLIYCLSASAAHAAYPQVSLGNTIRLGEFIYDDNYNATTTANCSISIYDPANSQKVNAASMTANANSFYYYDYTVASNETEGTWPSYMSCGSLVNGDLIKLDKTFVVAPTTVASSTIAAAVWGATTRTLSSFGTLVADTASGVWSATTRLLTGASLDTGSLATQTDVQNASSSLAAAIVSNTSGITTAVNNNTSAVVGNASTSLANAISSSASSINSNTTAQVSSASTSLASAITASADSVNTNTNSVVQNASTSLSNTIASNAASVISDVNTNTNTVVSNASSSLGTLIASLPASVWGYSGRTLSNFGTLVSDTATAVWGYGTRLLTGATLDTGSLATQTDVQSASSSLSSSIASNTAAVTSAVNSTIQNASSSLAAAIVSNTSGIAAAVNSNTDTRVNSASSSLASAITASTDSVNTNTNNIVAAASSSLGTSIASLPSNVWNYSTRTLSNFGTLAADTATAVWSSGTRLLTGATLNTGSLATQTDVQNASSSLAAAISLADSNNLTAADIWNYSTRRLSDETLSGGGTLSTSADLLNKLQGATSSIAVAVWQNSARTLTNYGNDITAQNVWDALTSGFTTVGSIGKLLADNVNTSLSSLATLSNQTAGYTVRMSDFSSLQAGKTYRAKITVLNATSTPQNAYSTPTITLYDADRNVVVSGVSMTNVGTGVYEYTYLTSSGSAQGVWESVVNTEVSNGKTISTNDYWLVSGSPAQVIINSVTANSISDISANVTITNEGLTGYEYQYEWCVVSNANNACGGGDDSYHGTGAKFINPGEDWNTDLTATVPSAGSYYFKLVVYFGTESSGSSRSFEIAGSPPPDNGGGSGGGGGGGGSRGGNTPPAKVCRGADFNQDNWVNATDFSILLAYWKTNPPFANSCVDINQDNKVNTVDFSILLAQWGTRGKNIK